MDIEATGLDIDVNVPLEVGIVVTEGFEIVDEKNWLIACADYELEDLHPEVIEMHTANGLFQEIVTATAEDMRVVDLKMIDWLEERVPDKQSWYLCGSSIWWDRKVLERRFPATENRLHHRMIDVSSINETFCEWAPGIFYNRPIGDCLHRAIPDCKDSFEQWKYYKYILLGDA